MRILQHACAAAGVDASEARELHARANQIYLLPQAGAIARLRHTYGSAEWTRRLSASIQVARWLDRTGFGVTVPLEVAQPVELEGWVVTFWRREELQDRTGDVADLARLLRELHSLPAPPLDLPATDPLGSLPAELDRPGPLTGEQRDWLHGQVAEITAAYGRLDPPGSRGLIHGDARIGNLLPVTGGRWLLGDWDSVSAGPRVQDLVPTILGHRRFGRPRAAWERLCRAYGVDPDLEDHPAVRLLCRARELRSLAAYLRTADRPETAAELTRRLRTLMTGDNTAWREV